MPSKMRKNSLKKKSFNKKKRQAKTPKMKGGNCSIKNKKNMSGGAPGDPQPLSSDSITKAEWYNTPRAADAIPETYNTPRALSMQYEISENSKFIIDYFGDGSERKKLDDFIYFILGKIGIKRETDFNLNNYRIGIDDKNLYDFNENNIEIFKKPKINTFKKQ